VQGLFRLNDKLGRRLVLILKNYPCSWGKCSFCPFHLEQSTNTWDIIVFNRRIIREAIRLANRENYERIAVFNGGSFSELPYDTVNELAPLAKNRIFEIESRSNFITDDFVKNLLRLLAPRKLVIRIGFEVADEEIREKLLRKGMPDSEIKRILWIRQYLGEEGLPVEFWVYVLFGIEYIPDEKVVESVKFFKKYFDGVIAIKYKKYLPEHPEEKPVSEKLARFLEREADLVDWGGEEWDIEKKN